MAFNGPTSAAVQITGAVSTSVPGTGSGQTIVTVANGKAGTSITAGTGALLRTVTASKTYYVTSISLTAVGGGNNIELRDGTTIAGTLKCQMSAAVATTTICQTFPVPIAFTAGVFIDTSNTGTVGYCINGYEA